MPTEALVRSPAAGARPVKATGGPPRPAPLRGRPFADLVGHRSPLARTPSRPLTVTNQDPVTTPWNGMPPARAPGERVRKEREDAIDDATKDTPRAARDESALDPSARVSAQLAPPTLPLASPPPDLPVARAMRSLEDLLPGMVRRIAWTGDARRGSVRLELGQGAYAGAVVLVHADAGSLRLEVSGRDDADALQTMLASRLQRRGLVLEGR